MKKGLLREALVKYLSGVILLGALLFLPAGTFAWRNAWLMMILLFAPMLIAGLVMYLKAPDLLKSRLDAKESRGGQKAVILMSGLMFLAAFILAGLNFRFRWIIMPGWTVAAGAVVFLLSYAMFGEVLRENAYLSRTIKVQEGQKVVDTGLYGVVRHPMYSATVLLFLSMPVILGSPISLAVTLAYIPIIVRRILDEEEVLKQDLEGYESYMGKVRYRLIPHLW